MVPLELAVRPAAAHGSSVESNGRMLLRPRGGLAMKTLFVATVTLVMASVCPGLWADDEAKDKSPAERIQDLNLTPEQEAKIEDIMKASQPKFQEVAKELGAIVKEEADKVRDVLTPEQKEKLQAQREERKEQRAECLAHRIAHLREFDLTEAEVAKIVKIRSEYQPKIAKAMEGLKGLLTDEQRKAREDGLNAGKKHKDILESLNLSADQKEKVAAVCKDLATLVREEMEKVTDVLTEEQQAKLPELKEERKERVRDKLACRVANSKDLNLTGDQKAKIDDIRKEYRPKVHDAGNKVRGAVREEVGQIIAIIKD
jgi:Spy/CpxP family protein refolding chaperone